MAIYSVGLLVLAFANVSSSLLVCSSMIVFVSPDHDTAISSTQTPKPLVWGKLLQVCGEKNGQSIFAASNTTRRCSNFNHASSCYDRIIPSIASLAQKEAFM
jgi:hypothetical protein